MPTTTRKPRAKKPTAVEELAAEPQTPEVLDPDGSPVVPQEQPQQEPPNGVIVLKITDEQGNISTDAQPIGNVQPTEVQTLLELGVSSWRTKIGLDKSA